MAERFYCPVQAQEDFSFDGCRRCKYFEMTKNIDGKMNASCRKNGKKKDESAYLGLQGAFWMDWIGMEYQLEIIEG